MGYFAFSFDLFSVHDILIILLMYHISAASSLLSKPFINVQHSHPYRNDGPYGGFRSFNFGANSDISVGEGRLYLSESVFKQGYSFLYFCVSPDNGVIVKPKYLKVPTCVILSPFQRM